MIMIAVHHITAITIALLYSSSFSISIGAHSSLRKKEKLILDQIIGDKKYDNRIRPSGTIPRNGDPGDGPCVVDVNIFLRSISKISDLDMEYSVQLTFREEWIDERLQYNEPKIKFLTLTDPNKIWKPDLFFSNEKEGHFHDIIMPNVLLRIYPNGSVLYSIRISLLLACPMDLKYYPLDEQECNMRMASYGYTTDDLEFRWRDKDPVQYQTLQLPRFAFEGYRLQPCLSDTNTGVYPCLMMYLNFERKFSYYLIQIYMPCCMLVIVSWVSFWLDPNAIPARVSLGVTTLLTMATQISGINASLPPVSYIKAIDVWTGVCLAFVFGALLEFALVNYASRSDAHRAARDFAGIRYQRRWDKEGNVISDESSYSMEDSLESKKRLEDFEEKLAIANRRSQELEREKNNYKLEAQRLKEERDSLRSQLQELQAQIFESNEELQLRKKGEQEKDLLIKENHRLHQQLMIFMEKLRKAEDKVDYLMEEKWSVWSSFHEQAKMLQEGALCELKKTKSINDDLSRENCALQALNKELSKSISSKDLLLEEHKNLLDNAQRSYSSRCKALQDHITALEKVNTKFREALRLRNGCSS